MVYLILYIGCIFGANWAISTFGFIPVWPGLLAPAGVLFVGASFTLRDLVQERLGRRWTMGAIVIGAGLSYFVSPAFALASGVTFLISEASDFFVYTPLKGKTWLGAVAASNTVGLVVDSVLFLWLAFGSLQFIAGQIVGKMEMTILAVVLIMLWRAWKGEDAIPERGTPERGEIAEIQGE